MREEKTCQNCKNNFTIEPEDFLFYKKIDVPAPTFCPECRTVRRMSWRNTRALHKRVCDATGQAIISIYAPEQVLTVYDQKYWWSDNWDPLDYGQEYDFKKAFFEQWDIFRRKVPMMSMSNSKAEGSDYCNVAEDSKNSYLVSASYRIEDTLYSNRVSYINDSSDLYIVHKSDACYEDVLCNESSKLFYSLQCVACVNSYFLYDCRGCTDCFMSSNLRNKSYYFKNEQLSKEEYNKKMQEINFGSYSEIKQLENDFINTTRQAIHKYAHLNNTIDCTGDNIQNAKNCHECFDISDNVENLKFVNWSIQSKDSYDCTALGVGELSYESFDLGVGSAQIKFSSVIYNSANIEYSFNCYASSHLFACIGLRNKQYCIFNKQYTQEEYEELISRIKQHMMDMPYIDQAGLMYFYGEFFPVELAPFGYNETIAFDYYPISREIAQAQNISWYDEIETSHVITKKADELPDDIQSVDESILQEVIECAISKEPFRIVASELAFYKKYTIPLPRLHFNERHKNRLAKRNSMRLYKRITEDGVEVMTPFAPDRPEKIYSEKGYQDLIL